MRTAPTNKKVRELIKMVVDGRLIPRPEFQRRLVWKNSDKNHFLDSVLGGYPFPEIYVADGDVNLDTGEGNQLLVDGLQRVSTLVEYFTGNENLKLVSILPYLLLDDDKKAEFLQYDVSVRDLGSVSTDEIVEVFRRINATSYSLTDIEISNALYRGEFKEFAENLSLNEFFSEHRVFNASDFRRMGDLRFAILLAATVIIGYFNRDEEFEGILSRYNEEFSLAKAMTAGFNKIFNFIESCNFEQNSRVWRKADLFTLIIELYELIIDEDTDVSPNDVAIVLNEFYQEVDGRSIDQNDIPGIYYKAALQATNDRLNRLRRGIVVGGLIRGVERESILAFLKGRQLA